ncbi:hypothetical protein SBRCBS47491_006084 [Sporothrix bragantina]|uniref:Peptidase A1 domain-containing protein n=1 Tax=Sporothrix bragantina TaxID=671064 RepID=A0ABP0C2W8_9PEZI
MKTTTTLAVLASSLIAVTNSLVLQKRTDGPARVISMATERRKVSNPAQRDRIRRRSTTVAANLDNEETLYFVNATLGTPAQSLRLHIDTGSSDLWVNTPSSTLCEGRTDPCAFAGTYTANSSSTYNYLGSYFNISYVDGSGASGDYVTDTFTMGSNGSTTLSKLQFGIGYTSSSSQGILGIGYKVNEVQVGRAGKAAYANLPAQMVEDGIIQSNSYSLWLNDLDADTGNILFGGVDTARYSGALQTLPVQKQAGVYSEFLITLTGLQLGTATLASNMALAVLLDSGSSLTYLPDSIVQTIYNQVGATYDSSEGAAYVPCSLADKANSSITFQFSSPSITVDVDELVLDLVTASGKRPTFRNGQTACLFGIAPAGSGTNVLGDTFLRSAYVVYDLDNNQISLAQTVFNTTASSVLEISSGTSGVPDATLVANSVAATSGLTLISSNSNNAENGSAGLSSHGALAALTALVSSTLVGLGLILI